MFHLLEIKINPEYINVLLKDDHLYLLDKDSCSLFKKTKIKQNEEKIENKEVKLSNIFHYERKEKKIRDIYLEDIKTLFNINILALIFF